MRPGWRVRFRHVPFVLGCLGFAGLVVALARPRVGLERTESWTEGVDIVVALDASGSMAAEDFKPKNRFFVAKAATRTFVEGRPQDRLGLIAFAGRSRTVVPLTTDRAMLLTRLSELKLGDQGDGTAIGMALGNSLARLGASKAKSKVVVLVTDGGNNAGEIDPDTAANVAKGLGIRVYTIGVGTAGGPVEIPVPGPRPGHGARRRAAGDGADRRRREAPRPDRRDDGRTLLPRHRPRRPRADLRRDRPPREDRGEDDDLHALARDVPPRRDPRGRACSPLAAGLALFAFPVAPR